MATAPRSGARDRRRARSVRTSGTSSTRSPRWTRGPMACEGAAADPRSAWRTLGRPRHRLQTAGRLGDPARPQGPRGRVRLLGRGDAPDAAAYGDEGSDTAGEHRGGRRGDRAPQPRGARARDAHDDPRRRATAGPGSAHGRATERSAGKDTTTGHWEMMGIRLDEPFPLYPDGFPPEVIEPFERAIGREVLGNRPGVRNRDHRRARRGAPADRAARSSTRPATPSSRSRPTRRSWTSRRSTSGRAWRGGSSRVPTRSAA